MHYVTQCLNLPVTKLDSVGWVDVTCPKVPEMYPNKS